MCVCVYEADAAGKKSSLICFFFWSVRAGRFGLTANESFILDFPLLFRFLFFIFFNENFINATKPFPTFYRNHDPSYSTALVAYTSPFFALLDSSVKHTASVSLECLPFFPQALPSLPLPILLRQSIFAR